jgi:hypothetical protein
MRLLCGSERTRYRKQTRELLTFERSFRKQRLYQRTLHRQIREILVARIEGVSKRRKVC